MTCCVETGSEPWLGYGGITGTGNLNHGGTKDTGENRGLGSLFLSVLCACGGFPPFPPSALDFRFQPGPVQPGQGRSRSVKVKLAQPPASPPRASRPKPRAFSGQAQSRSAFGPAPRTQDPRPTQTRKPGQSNLSRPCGQPPCGNPPGRRKSPRPFDSGNPP